MFSRVSKRFFSTTRRQRFTSVNDTGAVDKIRAAELTEERILSHSTITSTQRVQTFTAAVSLMVSVLVLGVVMKRDTEKEKIGKATLLDPYASQHSGL